MLNAITRPFAYPIPRCDDESEKMGNNEFAITADLDAGYWQVLMHSSSRDKTGFFSPEGKKHFCNLPMGIKNAASFFVCMMMDLKGNWDYRFFQTEEGLRLIEWVQQAYKRLSPLAIMDGSLEQEAVVSREKHRPDSSIIIDDLLLFGKTPMMLLAYFVAALKVFLNHRVSIKLRKTRFLPSRAEFVGLDLLPDGNAPAQSKYKAIRELGRPILFGDLRMLIGFFGFYAKWIPWYEEKIGPWREVLKKKPPVDVDKEEEARLMANLWQPKEDSLLHVMKEAILSGPVLKRPDWERPLPRRLCENRGRKEHLRILTRPSAVCDSGLFNSFPNATLWLSGLITAALANWALADGHLLSGEGTCGSSPSSGSQIAVESSSFGRWI